MFCLYEHDNDAGPPIIRRSGDKERTRLVKRHQNTVFYRIIPVRSLDAPQNYLYGRPNVRSPESSHKTSPTIFAASL
jgi:hypothetical protein